MRVLVVDDEPIARARLVRLIERIDGVELAGEASNGEEAIAGARELAPDVLLLDIDMPGVDGLAVAEDPSVPAVVFTTAHADYALEAFELNAADYLLKPVSRERLERALDRVRARAGPEVSEPWRLVVTDGSVKRFVDARTIDCFTADQKYVMARAGDDEVVLRESLDALERRLAPLGFVRAHRGALVRRAAVTAYDAAEGGTLILASGERVPVSRRAAARVRAALGID